jgi:hypothetical protein
MTRTPVVESHCSTALLLFGSRSQSKIRPCRSGAVSINTSEFWG